MNKKKNKKRRIRWSFIGGRRPPFLDQNKVTEKERDVTVPESDEHEIEPIKEAIDNQVTEGIIENNFPVENQKEKTIILTKENTDSQDKACLLSAMPRSSDKRRKSLEALENATANATEKHLKEMEAVKKEVNTELLKWQQLMSDDLFNMFGEAEGKFIGSSTCCGVLEKSNEILNSNEELVETDMKLKTKSMEICKLHEELKLKHELLETAMKQFCEDSGLDSTINQTGAETPRQLIKKIVSLKK